MNKFYNLKNAKVQKIQGVPVLTVDDKPLGMMTFQWALHGKGAIDTGEVPMDSALQLKSLGEVGVQLYFVRIELEDPENIDAFMIELEEHIRVLRENVPDALAIVWFVIKPYEGFAKKYPEDVLVFNDGSTGDWLNPSFMGLKDEDTPRYTYASTAWKHEVGGMLRNIIHRINTSDLSQTIIGYFFFCSLLRMELFLGL